LAKVNQYRRGKLSKDADAAKTIKNKAEKEDLVSSPFVVEFEYGANKEGHWTYDFMVCQLEDCIDVLHVLHPEFDYVFLFDHSCGHNRQQKDGLNLYRLAKGCGGVQPAMRSSKILQADGFLGEYSHKHKLEVGQHQSMVYQPGDPGPFYLSEERRKETKYDIDHTFENRQTEKNKNELLDELALEQVIPERPKELSKKEVQALAEGRNIPIKNLEVAND
jgi:hypothetical protein